MLWPAQKIRNSDTKTIDSPFSRSIRRIAVLRSGTIQASMSRADHRETIDALWIQAVRSNSGRMVMRTTSTPATAGYYSQFGGGVRRIGDGILECSACYLHHVNRRATWVGVI